MDTDTVTTKPSGGSRDDVRREDTREALEALMALDQALGRVLRTTREPMLGRIRLAWWRESIARLDLAPPPLEPVLTAAAAAILPRGVSGAALAAIVDGWEALLEEPLDRAALDRYAAGRGGAVFGLAATLLGRGDADVAAAGQGWALADLVGNLSDDAMARLATSMAEERCLVAFARYWPRMLRPLGTLALVARADLAGIPPGSPRRAWRLLWHRLTGR